MFLCNARNLVLLVLVACLAACGCATPFPTDLPVQPPARSEIRGQQSAHKMIPALAPVIPAGHLAQVPVAPPPRAAEAVSTTRPFDGTTILNSEDVVRTVMERNPTLDQMRATAAAVAARFPQVTSLDDPNLAFTTAPGSAWSPNADYAAKVEISQKLLYPGKRGLKGNVVRAEAAAAEDDVEDARLILTESARSALADYTLAVRGAEVAEENAKLLREFHQNAETRYKTGQGQQQDVLQAEVEIARQQERVISLRRAKQVAIARLNTLMHLPPDSPLPPPANVDTQAQLPDVARLRDTALTRPDLRAVTARVAAEEATLAVALKEYNPDVEVMAGYDGFWQGAGGRPLQWQVGLRTNLPVRYARRGGAVDEARANVARRRAELARLADQVNLQIQEAFEQVREADDVVRLYSAKVLPAAEANVKEARSGYTNNKIPFLNLIEAQRGLTALKDRYYEAVAESARRRAALERAVGTPLSGLNR